MLTYSQFSIVLVCLVSFCLTACSNEEEVCSETISYGKHASSLQPVSKAGIKFPVTSVNNPYSSYQPVLHAFVYENGCMKKAYDGDDEFEFLSDPLTVKASAIYYKNTTSEYSEYIEFKNIKVNKDGFITSCDAIYTEEDEGEIYSEKLSVMLTYDDEGHLILSKYHYTWYDGSPETGTSVYTWENGNLIKMSAKSVLIEEGEEEREFLYEEEYTYDENLYPNPGIWNFYNEEGIGICDVFPVEMCYAGLLGKTTKNIPLTYKESQYFDDAYYNYTTNSVSYNDDGSVQAINSSAVYNYNYSNSSYRQNIRITFGYDEQWDENWASIRTTPTPTTRSIPGRFIGLHKKRLDRENNKIN